MKQFEYPESVLDPDNYSYRERQWRAPKVAEDEEIIFDEPGRVLKGYGERPGRVDVCCRSHYFRVTKPRYGEYTLRVQHGGGEESWRLDYDRRTIEGLAMMDSDHRYRLLWAIMEANSRSYGKGYSECEWKWRRAASEKRIKTRKCKNHVKVWIEERQEAVSA